jgi:tetratricopeptide (TPR) repeat protein
MKRSEEYSLLKDWDNAIADANKALEANPESGEAYFLLGRYAAIGNKEKALKYYTEGLRFLPTAEHYLIRADLYITLDMYDNAMKDLDTAINLNPDFGLAYFKRGSLRLQYNKDLELALLDLTKSEALESHNLPVYVYSVARKMQALVALNRIDEAIELTRQTGSTLSTNILMEALIHYHKGDYQGALEKFNKAIEEFPTVAEVYLLRGNCLSALKRKEEALNDYNKAIEIDPEVYEGYFTRGKLLLSLQQLDRAIEDLCITTKMAPNNSKAFHALAMAYRGKKQIKKALDAENIALQIEPMQKDYLLCRGILQTLNMEPQKALDDYTTVISLWPSNPLVFFYRGSTFLILNNYADAIPDFLKCIELGEETADVYFLLGTCYLHKREYKKSLDSFTKAIELRPNYPHAYYYRAAIHQTNTNTYAALKDINTAIRQSKVPVADFYMTRARLYASNFDPRASEDLVKVMELQAINKKKQTQTSSAVWGVFQD